MGYEQSVEPAPQPAMLTTGDTGGKFLPALYTDHPESKPLTTAVQNVYSDVIHPDNGAPTTTELSAYLVGRANGTLNEARSFGGRDEQPGTVVTRHRTRFDGWRWTGGDWQSHVRAMVGATVLLTAGANLVKNGHNVTTGLLDAGDEVAEAGHKVGKLVGELWRDSWDGNAQPETSTTTTTVVDRRSSPTITSEARPTLDCVPVTIPPEHNTATEKMTFPSGEATPGAEIITTWAEEIKKYRQNGYSVSAIRVTGSASDDWGSENSFRTGEPENQKLANERADHVATQLANALQEQGVHVPAVEQSSSQDIMDSARYDTVKSLAESFGYESVERAVADYDNPAKRETLPDALKAVIAQQVGDMRGATMSVTLEKDGYTYTVCQPILVHDSVENPPDIQHPVEPGAGPGPSTEKPYHNKHRDYDKWKWLVIPAVWPPLPAFRREAYQKIKAGKKGEKGWEIDDQIALKLYPQGVRFEPGQEKGELAPDAWAWTRKYQALIRDNRIKGMVEHNYVDEGNNDRALRVLFVDHEPTAQTQAAMGEIVGRIAELNQGRVPAKLNAISVFPTDSTGPQRDPSTVGLGIDQQYASNILGIAYGDIGLVEMQMPTEPSKEDLEKAEHGVNWVLAHEVAGHYTDVKERPADIVREHGLRARLFGKNRYSISNPWLDQAAKLYKKLQREDKKDPHTTWDLETTYTDVNDKQHDVPTKQVRTLPNPLFARRARKNGFPTGYSKTNPGELYAETAAQVVTGVKLPFPIGTETVADFAKGASVDSRLHEMFETATNVQVADSGDTTAKGEKLLTGNQTVYYPSARINTWYARLHRRSVNTPHPAQDELVSITTNVRG